MAVIEDKPKEKIVDKNWNRGISFLDPEADYWKLARNNNTDPEGIRKWNEKLRSGQGKIVD